MLTADLLIVRKVKHRKRSFLASLAHLYRIPVLFEFHDLFKFHIRPEERAGVHVRRSGHNVLEGHRHSLQTSLMEISQENAASVANHQVCCGLICKRGKNGIEKAI